MHKRAISWRYSLLLLRLHRGLRERLPLTYVPPSSPIHSQYLHKVEPTADREIVVGCSHACTTSIMQDVLGGRYVGFPGSKTQPDDGILGESRHERRANGAHITGDLQICPF